MRTIIDLPNELVDGLAIIAEKENKSRSALIREAVQAYLAVNLPSDMSAAFGMWQHKGIDALDYEKSLRAEWD